MACDAEQCQEVGGVAARRSGDGVAAVETQDADGEVAQAGHGPGSVAGADLAGVLGEGRVADVVQRLDAPMPSAIGLHRVLALPVTLPLPQLVEALNQFQPTYLNVYPSVALWLAEEQQAGRLRLSPHLLGDLADRDAAHRRANSRRTALLIRMRTLTAVSITVRDPVSLLKIGRPTDFLPRVP